MNLWDWIDLSHQNKPQGNAVSGGIMFMAASGLQIGWIFNNELMNLPWRDNRSNLLVIVTYVLFYIAAVAGLFIGSLIVDRVSKKIIYLSALTLALLGSLALIFMPNNLYLTMASRALVGFGHGVSYLTALIHASEIMTQRLRGMIIASMNVLVVTSMMIGGVLVMHEDQEANALGALQWKGIISAAFCILGMILVPIFTRESPVTLVRERKYNEALLVMVRLRRHASETTAVRSEFEEIRSMVEEDESSTKDLFDEQNLYPLQLIILLKVGSVLAFNYCVNIIRLKYATLFIDENDYDHAVMTLMIIRMLGCTVTIFTIDNIGRRAHFIVSYGGSSILLLAMAVLVAFDSSLNHWIIGIVQLVFEFLSGLGIGMISSVYAAEAFNTVKKPNSIAFASSVEMMLQAVIIAVTFNFIPSDNFDWIYLSIAGALLVVITIYLFTKLPETAKKSIRQTRTDFTKSGDKTNSFQIPPN